MSRYLIPVLVDNFLSSTTPRTVFCFYLTYYRRIVPGILISPAFAPVITLWSFKKDQDHHPPQQFFVYLFCRRPHSIFWTPYTISLAIFICTQWHFLSRSFGLEVPYFIHGWKQLSNVTLSCRRMWFSLNALPSFQDEINHLFNKILHGYEEILIISSLWSLN